MNHESYLTEEDIKLLKKIRKEKDNGVDEDGGYTWLVDGELRRDNK